MTDTEPESVQEEPRVSPSEILVKARERLGFSQKDVADKLFLTTTYIRHIDNGDFDRIPKPAFVRGYLRSYARLVELSADEIVALYEAELEASEPAPEIRGVTEEQVGTSSITGPVLQTGIIGLAGLILIIALVWLLVADDDEPRVTTVSQPSVTMPSIEPEPEYGLEEEIEAPVIQNLAVAAEPAEEEPAPADTAVTGAGDEPERSGPDEASAEETVAEPVDEEDRQPSIERIADGDRSFITVDAYGSDQIELRFSDECWVEVSDASHGLIFEDLSRDGDVLTVYGSQPFRLLLGKATGVEMIYNGRPFELSPHIAPDRTAKLTISE